MQQLRKKLPKLQAMSRCRESESRGGFAAVEGSACFLIRGTSASHEKDSLLGGPILNSGFEHIVKYNPTMIPLYRPSNNDPAARKPDDFPRKYQQTLRFQPWVPSHHLRFPLMISRVNNKQ